MNAAIVWGTVAIVAAIVGYSVGRWWRRFALTVRLERARESFRLQKSRLEELLVRQAQTHAPIRGLKWRQCQFTHEPLWLLDARHRHVATLVPIAVTFQPETPAAFGDDPSLEEPRHGVVLLVFSRGQWHWSGRTLFNLSLTQAAEKLAPLWQVLPTAARAGASPSPV
jgi:hypothetical protein